MIRVPRRFRYQSSGVFRESLALGIVTVVPDGSSMEADAKEFGAGVALFKPGSARSMIRALDRAVGSHTLASHAERAAIQFRRATDPETRFDSLLSSA
jgi:enoyl-CoA hydratase/carnithine racemase